VTVNLQCGAGENYVLAGFHPFVKVLTRKSSGDQQAKRRKEQST
jgi:hypothetical protein